jgi:hypothetical protein
LRRRAEGQENLGHGSGKGRFQAGRPRHSPRLFEDEAKDTALTPVSFEHLAFAQDEGGKLHVCINGVYRPRAKSTSADA